LVGGEEITEVNWAWCKDDIKMYHGEINVKFIKLYIDKFQLQAFLNMVKSLGLHKTKNLQTSRFLPTHVGYEFVTVVMFSEV
jgi:hypothetical protein